MLLFILIFFAMVIVVGVTTVIGFSLFLKRRTKFLKSENQALLSEPPPYQSLFSPTNEEIRALEREKIAKTQAKEREELRRLAANKVEEVEDCREIWRTSPDKRKTIELLRLAAASESAEIFYDAAENVIEVWRDSKIENLTADDLADLLDSHLKTLPQQERTAGAMFVLKEEIANLRVKSEF